VAQVLLEGEFNPGKPGLGESLDKLERRWRRQRLRELSSEIDEAQRLGDEPRLESLLREKTGLSRVLHAGSTRRTI
jgi:hypothetical protein